MVEFYSYYCYNASNNNYVESSSMMSNATKSFDTLATSLSALQNYFHDSTKLFSDLYLTKCSDASAKLSCPCMLNKYTYH